RVPDPAGRGGVRRLVRRDAPGAAGGRLRAVHHHLVVPGDAERPAVPPGRRALGAVHAPLVPERLAERRAPVGPAAGRRGGPRLGLTEQLDAPFRRKDGAEVQAIVSVSPDLGDDGQYIGSLAMVTDVTERKRIGDELQKERDFISAVLDTAGCLVVVLDRDGR